MDNEFTPEESTASEETPEASDVRTGPAWENRGERSLWTAFLQTARDILLRPVETFQTMRVSRNLGAAILFYLLPNAVAVAINSLFQRASNSFLSGVLGISVPDMPFTLASYFSNLLFFVFLLFLFASFYHLLLWMFRGAKNGFRGTFRVVAYVGGCVGLFWWVPVLGFFVALIWGIVLEVLGLEQIHETTKPRVIFAVAITLSVVVFTAVIVAVGMVLSGAIPGMESVQPEEV